MNKLTVAVVATLASCGAPAYAQEGCFSTEIAYRTIIKNYDAERVIAVFNDIGVIETWASTDTDDWFTFLTTPDGQSCLLATGKGLVVLGRSKGEPA